MRSWWLRAIVTVAAFGAAYFASSALASATEGTPRPKTEQLDVASATLVPPDTTPPPDASTTTATTTSATTAPATPTTEPRIVAVDADQLDALEVAPADDASAAARQQSPLAFRFIDPCIGTCPDIDPATIHPLDDPLPPIDIDIVDMHTVSENGPWCGGMPIDAAHAQLSVVTSEPAHVTISYGAEYERRFGFAQHVELDTTQVSAPAYAHPLNVACTTLADLASHPQRDAVHVDATSSSGAVGAKDGTVSVPPRPTADQIPPAYSIDGDHDDELRILAPVQPEGAGGTSLATYVYPEVLAPAASRDPASQCALVAPEAAGKFQALSQRSPSSFAATSERASGVSVQRDDFIDTNAPFGYDESFSKLQVIDFKVETNADYTLCLWWVARQPNGSVTVTKQEAQSVHQARRFTARFDITSVDLETAAPEVHDVTVSIAGCAAHLDRQSTGHHDFSSAPIPLCDFGAHPYAENQVVRTQLDGSTATGGSLVQVPYRPGRNLGGGTFVLQVRLPARGDRYLGLVTVRETLVPPPTTSGDLADAAWSSSSFVDVDESWRPLAPMFTGYSWQLGDVIPSSPFHARDGVVTVGFDRPIVATQVVVRGTCLNYRGTPSSYPTDVDPDPVIQPDPQHLTIAVHHVCPLEDLALDYVVDDGAGHQTADTVALGQPVGAVRERLSVTLVCATCDPANVPGSFTISVFRSGQVTTASLLPGLNEISVVRSQQEPPYVDLGAEQGVTFFVPELRGAVAPGVDTVLTLPELEAGHTFIDPGDPSLYTLTVQATPV